MRRCIADLYELGPIEQIIDSGWLFKAPLAQKPHQEHIVDICDLVWRFCVNYVPLNAVTRVIDYPIPRCDDAVKIASGSGTITCFFDAPIGCLWWP